MSVQQPSSEARGTLLVWDAPNIDMGLGTLLGTKPGPGQRPRFDAIGRWLLARAADPEAVEACVFANIAPGAGEYARPWVEALRSFGYRVFVKPKLSPDDDVDDAMLDHIATHHAAGRLRELLVASADGRNFKEPLEALADAGVAATVLGFSEFAGYALASAKLAFVDLEDVPGAFSVELPRVRLNALPPEGRWLEPTRPLSALARADARNDATAPLVEAFPEPVP